MSYIIVQPEFSAPVGMCNRQCHELHLCHCNPERDISHPVNEDHMAMTGCQLKSSMSACVAHSALCIQALETSSGLF